jgi:hypothetical protein
MLRRIIFILLLVLPCSIFAQKWKLTRYEASFGVGFANYFGDIGGSADANNLYGIKDYSITGTRPSIIVDARYKILQNVAIKLHLGGVMLGGNDVGSINEKRGLDQKGYSFNTFAFEHTIQGEYAFLAEDRRSNSFAMFNRQGMLNNYSKVSMYVFGGVGGLAFKPFFKGQPNPQWDVLKTDFSYGLVFPLGIGAKYIIDNTSALNFEFGGRYVLADNVDGLDRGPTSIKWDANKFNDIYYFASVSYIFRIKTSRQGYPILFRGY